MHDDFENATNFLILNVPMPKAMQHDYCILAVIGDDDDDKGEVKDQYYADSKYQNLSGKQCYNLCMLHENCGKGGNGRNRGNKHPGGGDGLS
mmetsp:Transcript_40658/g.59727  ORF Transcript_40658/g.59727 Transcript_40658/m.59727 type:complete len:92 (-) Transcript_40658:40-315(-)